MATNKHMRLLMLTCLVGVEALRPMEVVGISVGGGLAMGQAQEELGEGVLDNGEVKNSPRYYLQ
jgi:hypothetical protein